MYWSIFCRLWWLLKKPFGCTVHTLTAKTIQGASLALQSVHHVHGSHRLPLGVLCVRHRVPDNVLQEHLQHTASLLVDEAADSLHASPSGKTADGGLGDALDVVTKDLPVALGTSLACLLYTSPSPRDS